MVSWPTSWSFWSKPTPPPAPEPVIIIPPPPPPPPEITPTSHYASDLTRTQRTNKQISLIAAGLTFMVFTTIIGKRSTRRRILATFPKYYTQSNAPVQQNFNAGMDAFEALNIASLGVFSLGITITGLAMFGFDVVNLKETRNLIRSKYGLDGQKSEREVEEEMEEWVVGVLARKDRKAKDGKTLD